MDLTTLSSYDAFRDFYRDGLTPLATLESGKALDPAMLNYVDALAFGPIHDIARSGQHVWDIAYQYDTLRNWIVHNRSLLELMSVPPEKMLELNGDPKLLKPLKRYLEGEELSAKALSLIPDPVLKDQITMWQRYDALGGPGLAPFYPVSWKGESMELKEECAILMDPLEIDWKATLAPLEGKRALFVFPSKEIFAHCLSFNPVYAALQTQPWMILTEENKPLDWEPRELILMGQRPPWRDNQERIFGLLSKGGAPLQSLGRQLQEHHRAIHLGKKRLPALVHTLGHQIPAWDRFLDSLPPVGRRRSLRKKGAKNIAYVMPWIKSETVEAEQLVEALLKGDREQFLPTVFTSELQTHRLNEYPSRPDGWLPTFQSEERLLKRIHREAEIDLFFASGALPYLDGAREIADKLQERAIDVAVFIGDDILNEMASVMSDVPMTILWGKGRDRSFSKTLTLEQFPESEIDLE